MNMGDTRTKIEVTQHTLLEHMGNVLYSWTVIGDDGNTYEVDYFRETSGKMPTKKTVKVRDIATGELTLASDEIRAKIINFIDVYRKGHGK